MVNPATRSLILEAAERLSYRPDVQARSLMTGRTQTIAVIAADLGNGWVTPILQGVTSRVSVEGIVPIIAETGDDSVVLGELIDHMLGRRVDAMIVLAARADDARVIESAARIVPIVVAARPLEGVAVPVVTHDDRAGARLVAEHLVHLGHRVVTQIVGPSAVLNFSFRREAFSAAVEQGGIREVAAVDEAIAPTFEEGERLMDHLIEQSDQLPTAIFAHNDPMAIGAIASARRHGLVIPEDISIAGYNDMPLTEMLTPGLTTVRYPGWQVGREAADVAIRLLEREEVPQMTTLDPVFVPRGSTAPPPTHAR